MIFLRNREGNYLNLWANGENPNVKGRTHQTLNYQFCLFPPINKFCQNVVEIVIAQEWEEYGQEIRIWGNPFLGKLVFGFWGK